MRTVVTGGTGQLGTAVVGRLLDAGAECWIPVLTDSEIERFPYVDRVQLRHNVDLTDESAVEAFYAEAGVLDASIHLAGGFAMGSFDEVEFGEFDRLMAMNGSTCWNCCRAAVRAMSHGGRIVNVAARPALSPESGAGMVAYVASKAAVAAITQALGAEVAGRGILVNAVVPSILDTKSNREAMPDADHTSWAGLDDVAETIVFLASASNRVTRSGLVPVYGRC